MPRLAAWSFASVLLAGCGGRPSPLATRLGGVAARANAALHVAAAVKTPERPRLELVAVDADASASAGPVALARRGDRTLAFVADADDDAIVTVDVEDRAVLSSTPLGAKPSAVIVTRGGRLAALGEGDARVHVLSLVSERGELEEERAIEVAAEPVSATLAPTGDALLVASRWGRALSRVPLDDGEAFRVDLPRDPAAVLVSANGTRAIVAHAVGSQASIVDLTTHEIEHVSLDDRFQRLVWGTMKMSWAPDVPQRPRGSQSVSRTVDQSFALARTNAGAVFGPAVFVEMGAREAATGYGASRTVFPGALELDASTGHVIERDNHQITGSRCLLPRSVAFDPGRSDLWIACAGTAEIELVRVSERRSTFHRSIDVPEGPMGVALEPSVRRGVVWSAFARKISFFALEAAGDNRSPRGMPARIVASVALPRRSPEPSATWTRGRDLFYANFNLHVASDGRACASCHLDGRDDANTWVTPDGPRQTPMLVERLDGTAPYGWDGSGKTFEEHVKHTLERLHGVGLPAKDVEALRVYIASLRAPAEHADVEPRADLERGARIFASKDTGCSSCHLGAALADGARHDVDSREENERVKAFDTPSLHLVAHSAPYFHDGRFGTLNDLLAGSEGTMGHTANLPPRDRDALIAYLESL